MIQSSNYHYQKVGRMPQSDTKKRLITNLLLLLMVCFLGWVVYEQLEKDQQGPENLYSDTVGDSVQSISIQLPKQLEITLVETESGWFMVKPESAPANTKALQQLLTFLAEPIQTEYQAEGKNLSDFGLDDTAIRVRFNQVEYTLGKLNPLNHYRYVLHDERILLVNEVVYELLSRGVDGFKKEQ